MIQEKEEIVIPFVVGSIAFQISKKTDQRSYKWISYLRGINNENLSFLIKKVVFHLHPSCGDPIRESTSYPFEINQLGWGQFEILLDIHFNMDGYPPVRVAHQLRLHHNNPGSQTKKPLCSEVYDQFVFTKVTNSLRLVMKNRPGIPENIDEQQENAQDLQNFDPQAFRSISQYSRYWFKYEPQDHKSKLQDAIRFVKSQISLLAQKMKQSDTEVQKIYEDTIR